MAKSIESAIDSSLDDLMKSKSGRKGKGRAGKGKGRSGKGGGKQKQSDAPKPAPKKAPQPQKQKQSDGGGGGGSAAKRIDMSLEDIVKSQSKKGKGKAASEKKAAAQLTRQGQGQAKKKLGGFAAKMQANRRTGQKGGGNAKGGGGKGKARNQKGSWKGGGKWGDDSWGKGKGKRRAFSDWDDWDDWGKGKGKGGRRHRDEWDDWGGKGKGKGGGKDGGSRRGGKENWDAYGPPPRKRAHVDSWERDSWKESGRERPPSYGQRERDWGPEEDDRDVFFDRDRRPPARAAAAPRVAREMPRREAPPRQQAPIRAAARPTTSGVGIGAARGLKRSIEEDVERRAVSKRIKVTNIPRDLDTHDIKDAFEQEAGKVLECKLERGTAFIMFTTTKDARKAVDTFDRGELNGKTIEVTFTR